MRLDVKPSTTLTRRAAMVGALATGSAICSPAVFAQGSKSLIIAEPVHSLGYAPLYLAIDQGLYKSRGLDVSVVTTTNGAHVSALVSGQVWGNIGGPESDAMANVGKADPLTTVCNVVNRANVYVVARKGTGPKSNSDADIAAFLKGKRFALSRYGGTPDLLGRWLVIKVGLDPKKDIVAINQADSAAIVAMMKNGAIDVGVNQEPYITAGIEQGLWDEPFYSFPSLGDYAYSVISVRKSTMTREPQVVQAFVDATVQALGIVAKDRSAVEAMTHKEFPTLPADGVKATLDRAYADHLWSVDGMVTEQGYNLDMDVVYKTGTFTKRTPYASVVDMQFVRKTMQKS
jgi:NitT/TauT family transport system substrate-binding protein